MVIIDNPMICGDIQSYERPANKKTVSRPRMAVERVNAPQ